MRSMHRPALRLRRLLYAAPLAAGLPLAAPGLLAQPPAPPDPPALSDPAADRAAAGPHTLLDRIIAVVDEDPILASDLERVIALDFIQREPGESDEAYRRRVLEGLIDNRLRTHEIDRFGLGQVDVARVDQAITQIRSRFANEEEFRARLAQVDLDLQTLRQLVARQLAVLDYIDERLAVRVFVTIDEIQKHYEEALVPELRRRGEPVPPLAEVREDIREVLRQQRLNEEIDAWTEELRREADVSRFLDPPAGPLPPVIETIEAPSGPPAP